MKDGARKEMMNMENTKNLTEVERIPFEIGKKKAEALGCRNTKYIAFA